MYIATIYATENYQTSNKEALLGSTSSFALSSDSSAELEVIYVQFDKTCSEINMHLNEEASFQSS